MLEKLLDTFNRLNTLHNDNTYNTSIVNMRTNQTIKTYLRFELLAFSKDNKFLFANIRGEFGTIKLEND